MSQHGEFPRHLLSVADLGREGIEEILRLAESFEEVSSRDIPRVPALRGRSVALMFFEDSTRTRLSFDTAAKRLSAETLVFTAASSSLSKGESLRDTVQTVSAMGVDAMVVRHRCAGVPAQVSRWTDAAVLNAGDGWHEHPTQALLDCFTLARHRGNGTDLSGMRIAIVGDIVHSRVARSDIVAFVSLGAKVILVAPPTLLPSDMEGWPVETVGDLDEVLGTLDAVYLLRLQRERMAANLVPSLREYAHRFGMDASRMARLPAHGLVMHPGPMNRGVEISSEVADDPRCVATEQVSNGIAVRMAVLFMLLGTPAAKEALRAGSPRRPGSLLPDQESLHSSVPGAKRSAGV